MGLFVSSVANLIVENNEIRFIRYGGMQIGNEYGEIVSGLHDNLIRFNNVHHAMLLHDDCGGIYTLSRQEGTKIYQNWVHDIERNTWAGDYAVAFIYLDNNSSYITVEDNVIPWHANTIQVNQQTNSGVQAHDNIIRNNVTENEEIRSAAGPQMVTGIIITS
jgi:hypothetical protein